MEETSRLLTIRETSKQLNLPYRQLLEAVNAGTIPFYQVGNSHRLLLPSEVLDQLKSKTNGE